MKIPFEFQGCSYQVEAELVRGNLWIHFGGRNWCLDDGQEVGGGTSKSNRRDARHKKHGPGNKDSVSAPMPGKIIKVLAEVGARVDTGQVLVIMEAMKMEYTLKAERPVTISEVLVKVGSQVRLGETLVKFQEASEAK